MFVDTAVHAQQAMADGVVFVEPPHQVAPSHRFRSVQTLHLAPLG